MHVPSITFDVKCGTKHRQLVMTKGGIHCRKKDNWKAEDIWSASVSNLLRIEPHPEKKCALQIVVVHTYEVTAEDHQQALRILGAAKNLDLGQSATKASKNTDAARTGAGGGTKEAKRKGQGKERSSGPRRASKGDFDVNGVIGKGSFGEVSLVTHKITKEKYAMKVMKKSDCLDLYDDLYSEQKILAMLSHPFIVGMHYYFEDKDSLYYILDYVPGGELYQHLTQRGRFPEPQARFYMAEIVLALEYLHKGGVVYRDLKPENILLDKDGHIKVTDFGLSKSGITSAGGGAQTFCGTPQYLGSCLALARSRLLSLAHFLHHEYHTNHAQTGKKKSHTIFRCLQQHKHMLQLQRFCED